MTTAIVSNIQKYSIHDGPGIRSTVFLKGCPLRCAWCHNPENLSFRPEIIYHQDKCIGCNSCVEVCSNQALKASDQGIIIDKNLCDRCGTCCEACPTLALEKLGQEMTVEEVLAEVSKDEIFYQQSTGGVTLSGGEPLSQLDFAVEFLKRCKERGYHTTVDTCGFIPERSFDDVLPYVDLFLYDIKHLDDDMHQKYTKVPAALILNNLRYLVKRQANIWIRVPVIPTINDAPDYIRCIGQLMHELGLKEIYLLPYHKLAEAKYHRLHLPYTISHIEEPKLEQMQVLAEILFKQGINVHIGG